MLKRDWLIEKGCDLCSLFYIHLLFLPFPPPHSMCCDKEPGKENEECTFLQVKEDLIKDDKHPGLAALCEVCDELVNRALIQQK